MKKIVALLLCVALLMGCSAAFAEDFQLRSGIRFGDTMFDILLKETTLTREGDDSRWFKGKIAGYTDAECRFDFTDSEKLNGMLYSFGPKVCTSRDTQNDVYDTLRNGLIRKYGTPIGNTGGTVELITGAAFDHMLTLTGLYEMIGFNTGYTTYDEWKVDCGDYYVKIDMVSYYYNSTSGSDQNYGVDLSYYRYTYADYLEKLMEKQGQQNEVDNDL